MKKALHWAVFSAGWLWGPGRNRPCCLNYILLLSSMGELAQGPYRNTELDPFQIWTKGPPWPPIDLLSCPWKVLLHLAILIFPMPIRWNQDSLQITWPSGELGLPWLLFSLNSWQLKIAVTKSNNLGCLLKKCILVPWKTSNGPGSLCPTRLHL